MQGYSRDKSDFREQLVLKYRKHIMSNDNELVLVTTEDCTKCKFIRPHLEEWCQKNWYKFKEMKYSQSKWMEDITSVPCAMIGKDVILDYDAIIELITKKKSFY